MPKIMKLLVGGAVLLATLLLIQEERARAATSGTVNVSATVNDKFELTLNKGTINLSGDPGGTVSDTVTTTVKSNRKNVKWEVRINCNQDPCLKDSSIGESIPNANFTHSSESTFGTILDSGGVTFSNTDTAFWQSPSDGRTGGAGKTATTTYQVVIPADQAAGTYSTVITHTLMESP